MRPPLVYGRYGGPLGDYLRLARKEGFGRYVGTGLNKWSCVHVEDLADLYVLVLEKAPAGSVYNAAYGDIVTTREIAEAMTAAVGGTEAQEMPFEQALKMMGRLARINILDIQISGEKARRELGWQPKYPSLTETIKQEGLPVPT